MAGKRRLRRGIYLLPTLFTVGNLFCGFSSIIQASRGDFEEAAGLIILAGILDLLDGRIARLTGTTSEFGVEFDSLADLVSFGVAPAYLMWQWALEPLHRLGWLVAFLYVVCAAMRLARFNIQSSSAAKRFFAGLPTPPAAIALACVAFSVPEPSGRTWFPGIASFLVVIVAVLMISRIRYRSFKDIDLRNRRSYVYVLPLAFALGAIIYKPAVASAMLAGLYVLSGPLGWCATIVRRIGGARADGSRERAASGEVMDEHAGR